MLRRALENHWAQYTPGLRGLGQGNCGPPAINVPTNPYTTNPLEYNAPAQNCYSVSNQASITNANLFEEWQNDASNAQLNGQPAPPCPAYQQPNCAAITAAIAQSAASGTPVDSTGWTTTVQGTPTQNANAIVSTNPVSAATPQPTPSANSPSIVPAAAVTPPVPSQTYGTVAPTSGNTSGNSGNTTDTLFGLPTWAVIGIAAVGAFFIFGGHR